MIEFLRELFFGFLAIIILYFAWSYGSSVSDSSEEMI
jgi:hypothetical protein